MRSIFLIGFCIALALPAAAAEAPAAVPMAAESPARPGATTLDRDGYRLQEIAVAPVLRDWEKEAQPQLAACAALPAAPAVKSGALHVTRLVKDRYFNKFFQGGGKLYRLVAQQKGVPFAIVIDSGVWRPSQLAAALATEKGAFMKQGDGYLLRLPLMIREGAGLLLQDSESLRLSRDRGVFVINLGTLYLNQARLEAWDEQAGAPALAAPEDSASFQPFLLGWSGSVTVIRESQVTGLGFAENLAHGLEFAIGPIGLAGVTLPAPPRVQVLDSNLDGLYSGVRGTSVPDMRICRNHFTQSRLNAVHLDLGSSGVIAENRITQTQGPYALYFSKSAQNVWVLRNDISENRRSGLSIADSSDLVFADNVIRQNFDAVFLQSSERILFAGNRILDNQRHGVSMRNVGSVRFQGDRIGPNRGVGIMAIRAPAPDKAAPLLKPSTPDGKPLPPTRPLTPVNRHLELLGVALEGNHSSAMVVEAPYSLVMDRTDVLYPDVRRRPVFRGVLNGFESDILYRMPRQRTLQLMPLAQKTAVE